MTVDRECTIVSSRRANYRANVRAGVAYSCACVNAHCEARTSNARLLRWSVKPIVVKDANTLKKR